MLMLVSLMSCKFQFTHPGRGATGRAESSPLSTMFQFTHPGRGATAYVPPHL